METSRNPSWMRHVLFAAAAYNLAWGAFTILFPTTLFTWAGMEPPRYLELWQCIGMIVGVFGVGYFIAAFNPTHHWPIVLVGFLGKVFGPIGMIWAVSRGSLPAEFAWTVVFNDLIWLIPFGLILHRAWRAFLDQEGLSPLPDEETLLATTATQQGPTIAELSQDREVMLFLLRHTGCTFCRESLADIRAQRASFKASGLQPVLVHMSPAKDFAAFASKYGLDDLPAVSDPERRLYRGLGVKRGSLRQLFGWKVIRRGLEATKAGHKVGALAGDGLQMPGTFRIRNGKIQARYVHDTAADKVDFDLLCPACV